MSRRLIQLGLICSALASANLHGDAGQPPLVLDDPSGEWNLRPVHRPIAPSINFEMVVSRPGAKERLVVLSSDVPNDTSESLSVFLNQLQTSFTSSATGHADDEDAEEMGYPGRGVRFELPNDEPPLECRLFVFTYTGRPWAVLHIRPKDAASILPNAFDLLRKSKRTDGIVHLEPYRVRSIPLTSFPISFEISRNRATNMISRIVVTEVPEHSETETAGVQKGDWVTRINGRKIEQIPGGVDNHSEIGRIFLDRPQGEKLELDLVAAATEKPYSVTLTSRGKSMIDRIRANAP